MIAPLMLILIVNVTKAYIEKIFFSVFLHRQYLFSRAVAAVEVPWVRPYQGAYLKTKKLQIDPNSPIQQ